jgi:prepilin-type processing-associated H-X9-DG protein
MSGKRALFNVNISRPIADVTDGTSNTVGISEIIAGPQNTNDLRGEWWLDVGCHYEHMYSPNSKSDAMMWSWTYCVPTKVYCDISAAGYGDIHFAASSYHPGGVNVGLADGAVRFASDSINLAVWQALGSINGGGKTPEETSPDF